MNSANNFGSLTGRLARDPEAKGGGAVVTTTIAVDGYDSRTKSKVTKFIRIVSFGKTGERLLQYGRKGTYLTLLTHLDPREWEDPNTGQKRSDLSVVVDDFALGPRPQNQPAQNPGNYDPSSMSLDDPLPFGDEAEDFNIM